MWFGVMYVWFGSMCLLCLVFFIVIWYRLFSCCVNDFVKFGGMCCVISMVGVFGGSGVSILWIVLVLFVDVLMMISFLVLMSGLLIIGVVVVLFVVCVVVCGCGVWCMCVCDVVWILLVSFFV